MCGISGIVSLSGAPIPALARKLQVMNDLLRHRGPDEDGVWMAQDGGAGFASRRLKIIDLTAAGHQPMTGANRCTVVHNGEVYNYRELRESLGDRWRFRGTSDTETILAANSIYGDSCVDHLRGMFAFAIWDGDNRRLIAARDRLGIKPFYYAVAGDLFLFASEAKALLPFLPGIATDDAALAEYLTFQYVLEDRTLFEGIRQLPPGHRLTLADGQVRTQRYWDVDFAPNHELSESDVRSRLRDLVFHSMELHMRADVPIESYVSGGLDSSLVAILSSRLAGGGSKFFHGKFSRHAGFDESRYAALAAAAAGGKVIDIDIRAQDFIDNIESTIRHLDYPVAGPGAFPQFMVSRLASEHAKVVLGGQGGDEVFGGYVRYLVAYLDQTLRSTEQGRCGGAFRRSVDRQPALDLPVLREYGPMLERLRRDGAASSLDSAYFLLIDRSSDMTDEIDWNLIDTSDVYGRFRSLFNAGNVGRDAVFDRMTRFDLKHMLPALLHVEDRMSMAHGLESRLPLLDHPIVEFVAGVPEARKFAGFNLKHLLKDTFADILPREIVGRRDKMGFPVPLNAWFANELKDFVGDLFSSETARSRGFVRSEEVLKNLTGEAPFSRKTWGLLCLELWQRVFHDRAAEWRALSV